ncbi:hypothetical protein SDC9_11700 [bioreactor metagenome]|uniref:Uncharacterized protein n=1 Tax=bioreactor metagenome TaxID=1076179 RepID=A0A644TIC5_9ZZZZ
MKEIHGLVAAVELIPAATYDADNTPAAVDLIGFEAAEIALEIGVGGITFNGTNKIEFKLTHSDDNSTYTAVIAEDLVGSPSVGDGGIIKSLVAAHAAATVEQFGYIGGKRFLKLLADFSGTHGTGTPIGAQVIKGRPHHA